LELDALKKATEEFKALGANFIAISPQLQSFNREFTEEKKLTFEILSDPGNEVAQRLDALETVLRGQPLAAAADLAHRPDGLLVTTTEGPPPGMEIVEVIGLVRGNTIRARHLGHDIIAQLKEACGGDLDRVRRIVKLGGFVNSTPDFKDQPKVINGASDLMVEVFGDKGRHARAAVSAGALPAGVAVEVDAIAEIA